MEKITISKEEYNQLKKKAKFADDAMIRLNLIIDDVKHGRVKRVA